MAKQHGECVSTVLSEDSQDVKLGGQTFKAVIKRRWDVHYELPEIVLTLDDNLLPSVPAPDTLQKFRAFWDSSGSVLCPADHVVLHQGDRVIVWDSREHKFFQTQANHLELLSLLAQQKLPSKEFVWILTRHLPSGHDDVEKRPEAVLMQAGDDYHWTILPTNVSPERSYSFYVKPQIIKAFPQYAWQSIAFKGEFPELDQVTTELQVFGLSLDHLKKNLDSQENAAKEVFEAFGIKFPINETTRWAVLLILCIQMYFWLHLSECYKRGFPKADVAWIGVYANWAAKGVSALTLLIVPVSVVLYLCARQGLAPTESINRILCAVAVLLSALLAALTIRAYRRANKPSSTPSVGRPLKLIETRGIETRS